jgi:CRISPR-associated protein Cas1
MPRAAAASVVVSIKTLRTKLIADCSTDDDRAGKPSLSLDLIEEFRQVIVDRTVFGLLNRGAQPQVEAGRLDEAARQQLAEKVLERLDGREPHEGKQHTLRTIVQMQARSLAAFLRKDRATYAPFKARW